MHKSITRYDTSNRQTVWNCPLISTSNGTAIGWKGFCESSKVCQEYSTILAQLVERIEESEWHKAFWKSSCNNWKGRPTNSESCRRRLHCFNKQETKCFETAKHQETIRWRLKEAGAKFSLPISKPFLTENHRYDRLRWPQVTCDIDWNQVTFSDETTPHLNSLKRHIWYVSGKRKIVRRV